MKNSKCFSLLAAVLACSGMADHSWAACDLEPSTSNQVLFDTVDPAWLANYVDDVHSHHFRTFEDRGWAGRGKGAALNLNNEFTRHVLASTLVLYGVTGTEPAVSQFADTVFGTGWGYDGDSIVLSSSFHRSGDEWGILASDRKYAICSEINFFSGERYCGPKGTATLDYDGAFSPISTWLGGSPTGTLFHDPEKKIYWGRDTVSGVEDDSGRGDSAAFRWVPTPFNANPEREITYYCPAFSGTAVGLASIIVHENWHAMEETPLHVGYTNFIHPSDSGGCELGQRRCDVYNGDLPSGHSRKYEELALHQRGTGAYQVDQRFTCDLAVDPADWVPIAIQKRAIDNYDIEANKGRFVNLPGGQSPYTCQVPEHPLTYVVAYEPEPACALDGGTACFTNAECSVGYRCGDSGCCVVIVE